MITNKNEKTINCKGKMEIIGFDNPNDVYDDNTVSSIIIKLGNVTFSFLNQSAVVAFKKFVRKKAFTVQQLKVSSDIVYDFTLKVILNNTDYQIEQILDVISIDIDDNELSKIIKNDEIKQYRIPVSYEKCGFIHILGTSLDNAIERAEKQEIYMPCPTDDEYCDGSFSINSDFAEYYNKED